MKLILKTLQLGRLFRFFTYGIRNEWIKRKWKYFYLDESLQVNPYSPNTIGKGDIMLFGSSCLVIFYENFNTSYSYTRIGKINNANNLDIILGNNDATVTFSK